MATNELHLQSPHHIDHVPVQSQATVSKLDMAIEFIEFLTENNINIADGHTRDKLKNLYCERFKALKKAIDPKCKTYSFYDILNCLKIGHFVSYGNGGKIFIHQKPIENGGQGRNRMAAKFPVDHQGRSHTSRSRRPKRLAVDQFISTTSQRKKQKDVAVERTSEENFVKTLANGSFFKCDLCKVIKGDVVEIQKHIDGKRHRVQLQVHTLSKNRAELTADKNGVTITSDNDSDDGVIHIEVKENETKQVAVTIQNINATQSVEFEHCEMLKRIRVFNLADDNRVTDSIGLVTLSPGESYVVMVSIKAKHAGRYSTPVGFQFSEIRPGQDKLVFTIVRYLSLICTNSVVEDLRPTMPYVPPPRVAKYEKVQVEDGVRLPTEGEERLERVIDLPPYHIPHGLRRLTNHGFVNSPKLSQTDQDQLDALRTMLNDGLNLSNHSDIFSLLLHMEEIQMEVDITKYNMDDVTMEVCKQNKKLLILKVPGLAEKRPSVLKGDSLFVRPKKQDGRLYDTEYKGYVHNVGLSEVWLGFSPNLLRLYVPNMKFKVRFTFNRLPSRLQHRACKLADENSLGYLLFPSQDTASTWGKLQSVDAALKFKNKVIEDNTEQRRAVCHIVAGTSRPSPYLVFGPPGTGKTVTIVEAMKQIIQCLPDSHILACAPSNSASDLIVSRLLEHMPKSAVIRLNAFSRAPSTIPPNIRDCCNFDKHTGQWSFPDRKELMKYKIVVSTLVTAGRIATANFPSGHFTHVFIDEAGYAMEPECLIGIAGVLDLDPNLKTSGGQLVLAGDPKQLGPILRSPLAIKYGLGMSFLERLMTKSPVYECQKVDDLHEVPSMDTSHGYNNMVLTKLVRSYRSHPSILKLPNEMFYEGELQTCADELQRESLCSWDGLPRKGFPVVFHGIVGEDMREERSPSFFNPQEAACVLQYVQDLVTARGIAKIKESQIGIISPYRKQVQKIQKLMKKYNYPKIKVGAVEEFQGDERKIIIISTVRSNPDYLGLDRDYKLGFLNNPKRFNVALTRAKALLVVIGNPYVLSQDIHWKRFIDYCRTNRGYTGCEFDDTDEQMDDILQRFAAVKIDDQGPSIELSQVSLQEDPEWKGDF